MSFRIKKLTITNFKAFPFLTLDIKSRNLTLLDGPNGFGKTSFYDALELLFTGYVSRYTNLDEDLSNKRKSLGGYPLLYNKTKPGESLTIEGEIEFEGKRLKLKRTATKEILEKAKRIAVANFEFHVKKGNEEWERIIDDELFLIPILGSNYKKNYGLFHYIEQEENTSILKSKGESKQQKIDHLFDVGDYRQKLEKISKIKTTISKLKTASKKEQVENLKAELENLKNQVISSSSELTPYNKIIEEKEIVWDKEHLDFNAGTYSDWVGENGVLSRIKLLKNNCDHFLNHEYNKKLTASLALTEKYLSPLLRFSHRISEAPKFREDILLNSDANEYLNISRKGVIRLIEENKILPNKSIVKKISKQVDLQDFKSKLEEVRKTLDSAGELSRNLSKLQSSRSQYLNDYNIYTNKHKKEDPICPTCGFDWIEKDTLLSQFKIQEVSLKAILDASNATLQQEIKNIEDKFFIPIRNLCSKIITKEASTINYKIELCKLSDEQVSYLTQLQNNFSNYNIDLNQFYLESFDLQKTLPIEKLISEVSKLYKPVTLENLGIDFNDLFEEVFESNSDRLIKLDVKSIDLKINYLKQQYSKSKLKEIKEKEDNYKKENHKLESSIKLENDLKSLVTIYTENINDYIESISKGIEILFHIYSGRLLQNFHNGLGVFIESDGKSITFKDTATAEHDVIFSMSSGQLSSLVIAFTMALNHKYANNPLLMIDDPVQTMDEINVAGFIDLLRHEFRERQIFISTHEDHTSSYFRYKFEKANLEKQRINFKNEHRMMQ